MNGINIQTPWSQYLINGSKSVETRSYPLPKKYEGVELALIETPGRNRHLKTRIIGTITFSHCFRYKNETEWKLDTNRHKVGTDNINYGWDTNKPKYGWVVSKIVKFDEPVDPPKKRGIIYAAGCME
jgi:hypothetical protein